MFSRISLQGRVAAAIFLTAVFMATAARAQDPKPADDKPAADRAKKEKPATKPASRTKGGGYQWASVNRDAEQNRRFVVTWLRTFPTNAESIEKFRAYYVGYGFKRLVDPRFLPKITDVRREFQRDLRDAKDVSGTSKDAFNELNALAFKNLPFIIRNPKFHPSARYNATLILGDLNLKKAARDRQAIPLPDVLPKLTGILMQPNQLPAVRVAAMIGIERQAEAIRKYDTAVFEANRGITISTMLKVLAEKEPRKGCSVDGNLWLRRQACEVLGELGDAGPGGTVAKALLATASDQEEPIWVRCAAARSIGQLADARSIDPKLASKTLSALAVDVCRHESQRATDAKTPVSKDQLVADLASVHASVTLLAKTHTNRPEVTQLAKKFEELYSGIETAQAGTLSSGRIQHGINAFLATASSVKPPIETPMSPDTKTTDDKVKPDPSPEITDPGPVDFD